jgi:hypothetical protein
MNMRDERKPDCALEDLTEGVDVVNREGLLNEELPQECPAEDEIMSEESVEPHQADDSDHSQQDEVIDRRDDKDEEPKGLGFVPKKKQVDDVRYAIREQDYLGRDKRRERKGKP